MTLIVVSEARAKIRRSLLRTTPEGLRITGDDLLPVAVIAGPPAFDLFAGGPSHLTGSIAGPTLSA
jgi:hypothetical protein